MIASRSMWEIVAGWVKSYQTLLELSSDEQFSGKVQIDLSDVRPAGEDLKGFGALLTLLSCQNSTEDRVHSQQSCDGSSTRLSAVC